jgi:hypothetical protein
MGSDAPNLAWQSELTRQLRQAEPVLAAATADDIVCRLGETAPVVLTGWGPTHEGRTGGEVRFRSRRSQ